MFRGNVVGCGAITTSSAEDLTRKVSSNYSTVIAGIENDLKAFNLEEKWRC
jgi:hypothetical protein